MKIAQIIYRLWAQKESLKESRDALGGTTL